MEFDFNGQRQRPLAWRMMPESLEEFCGQEELLGEGKPLRRLIEQDRIVSLILFGPPGTGKTALSRIIARKTRARYIALNAVTSGVKDIRDALVFAKREKTILFIDEIHRFNRLQQDALLPHVESGEIILIGASTQNPFFALIPALSSRSHIFEFKPLKEEDLITLLNRAITSPKGLGEFDLIVDDDALKLIALYASGDARKALNLLELAFLSTYKEGQSPTRITTEVVRESTQSRMLYYDEEEHYNIISAFIKSMRGSDPDAALYWLARMIESGEDPMFIARRIVICASEDVGNADPVALQLAVAAMQAVEKIGMPEGRIPLAQATLYVATAPKSNASYLAIEKALEAVKNEPLQDVPSHLKDAHYRGAERLKRGIGYKYPHNFQGHYVPQQYMERQRSFYNPSDQGYERTIKILMNKRRRGRK
ncbi:MAG: replication-associated recombination protein A [Nitrospirae bacterium]|nr:MAG: replication-associated recombination protein A [Nitrospirota bacterium]